MRSDAIDSTQWLPRNSSVVNPYRMAQGDLDGHLKGEGKAVHIAHAEVKDITVLGELIRRGFLEQWHKEAAMGYLELQHAYRAYGACKSNSIYLAQMFGGTSSNEGATKAYTEITRMMGFRRIRIIERAGTEAAENEQALNYMPAIEQYRLAFEFLVRISDEVWKAIRDEEQYACG